MAKNKKLSNVCITLILFAIFGSLCFLTSHPFTGGLIISLIVVGIITAFILFSRSQRVNRELFISKNSLYYDYTPIEFEQLTAEIYNQLGYKATLTPPSDDKGLDVVIETNGNKIGVQCKKYKNKVGPGAIREFIGSLNMAGITEGKFVTTSDYTKSAKSTARKANIKIELLTGKDIAKLQNNAEEQINTDLLPYDWWARLNKNQRIIIGVLFYLVVIILVTGFVYLLFS